MYRLLIVDDEPVIANGLVQLLQDRQEFELDICKAYSADEALEIAQRTKLDILVSDIRMPKKNGLQLVDEIAYYWPSCRMIFLTGYSEFNYVYEAIRKNVDSYILKSEGVEPIFEAVRKAIVKLEEEHRNRLQQEKAQLHLRIVESLLKKELLESVLRGEELPALLREERYADLDFAIALDRPSFILIGHADQQEGITMKLLEAAGSIFGKLLPPSIGCEYTFYDGHLIVWFLQPNAELVDRLRDEADAAENGHRVVAYLRGVLERVQNECEEILDVSMSFGISGNMMNRWGQTREQVEMIRSLIRRRVQLGQRMVIVDYERTTDKSSIQIKLAGIQQDAFKKGLLDQIHRYIEEHLAGDLSLTAIAEEVHLNPSYLSRYYKQISGHNLIEYIKSFKLESAIAMMSDPHLKLNEIALRVGFDSPSYFATFFKKMTGKSPQEYRNLQ
ncbi:response regulator transcription factor [Paenibacillus elgii]|uniref:response regulator transcription factor n=1 Tax=Paenibacillus elgii TaxID=189691 RepID=UPI00203D3D10|nr:response regulator [Paenibacillus elgii]MCM3272747.1 response regulator [Paenibacillus elgii]